jgi:cell shape-determining protein MreC
MSVAPRITQPKERINGYTVVVSEGAEDGISRGDELLVSIDDENIVGTVIDVGHRQSIVELRV